MTAAVVVQLSPADEASPNARSLLETCNIGLQGRARCVLGQDTPPGEQGVAVAILGWDGSDRSEARVDVGLRARGSAQWTGRVLLFSPADPEAERWRTVGFAIATLVGEAFARDEGALVEREGTQHKSARAGEGGRAGEGARAGEPGGASPDDRTASISSQPTSSSELARDFSSRSWLDARFVLAEGVRGSVPAAGGELRFASALDGGPWFLSGALRCTFQEAGADRISLVRPSASVGGGVRASALRGRLHFALGTTAFLELVEATGTDAATAVSASGGSWMSGFSESADVAWMWSQQLGIVAGIALTEGFAATDVNAHRRVVAHIPPVDLGGEAGVRFTFP